MNTEDQLVATATETKRRGRPAVEGSKRQTQLNARAERIASGVEIKRGRPKTKTDDTVEVKVKAAKPSKAKKIEKVDCDIEAGVDESGVPFGTITFN